MALDHNDPRPIYVQIAEEIKEHIVTDQLTAGQRVPSTNEISAFYEVNPTTAAKALTQLHDSGVVSKRRGLGMFVTEDARETVLAERHGRFSTNFIQPLLREARSLGLSPTRIHQLIDQELQS